MFLGGSELTIYYDEPPDKDFQISQSSDYSASRDISSSSEPLLTSGNGGIAATPCRTSPEVSFQPSQPTKLLNASYAGKVQFPPLTRPQPSTNSIPRPSSAGYTDEILSRKKNINPPNINVADYTRNNETGSNQGLSVGSNVLTELNQKIAKTNSNVRFRSSESQRLLLNETGLTLAGPDPFEISPDILNTVQKDRYSQILEKRLIFQPVNTQNSDSTVKGLSRPYLTMGIPLNGMVRSYKDNVSQSTSCLVPTPLPLPVKSSSFGNSSIDNKATVQNSSTKIPQKQTSKTTPAFSISPQDQMKQLQPQSLGVNMQPQFPTLTTTNIPNLVRQNTLIETHHLDKSTIGPETISKECSISKPLFPLENNSSNGTLFKTESTLKTQRPSDNSSVVFHKGSARANDDKERHSRVDNEILSLLPKPSALFYGSTSLQSETPKPANHPISNEIFHGVVVTNSLIFYSTGHQTGISSNPWSQLVAGPSFVSGRNNSSPVHVPTPSTSSSVRGTNEENDIIALLDPLAPSSYVNTEEYRTTSTHQDHSFDSNISRTEQMEMLYNEAFFTE
uniref:Protein kinase domain-containing protein n=1 Tax=Heterorhabditis bacteriophora TaxID=37862 RepID=A0A1I7XGM6_HETBA